MTTLTKPDLPVAELAADDPSQRDLTQQDPTQQDLAAPDLAELMSAFNEVTSRLEATHHQLQGEVERLSAELRDANAQLERSQRLAALGEMAAGISHEMRNPLACIGLYANILREDLGPGASADDTGSAEAHETATKIAVAVRRLDAIVGDVLTFAKDLTPTAEATGAADLLTESWETAAAEAARDLPDGPPAVTIDAEPGLSVFVDQTLAHQALVNVIANAVQAMAEAGTERPAVLLTARAAKLRPASAEGRARPAVALAVADHGPGIPGDVVARMFNPFFTTRNTGTGLGLAIVHRIVDAHGGTVTVANRGEGDSDETTSSQTGAIVTVTLPAPPETAPDSGAAGIVVKGDAARLSIARDRTRLREAGSKEHAA